MDWLTIIYQAAAIIFPLIGTIGWAIIRLDKRFDKIDKRFDKIEGEMRTISDRLARIEGAMWRNGTGG